MVMICRKRKLNRKCWGNEPKSYSRQNCTMIYLKMQNNVMVSFMWHKLYVVPTNEKSWSSWENDRNLSTVANKKRLKGDFEESESSFLLTWPRLQHNKHNGKNEIGTNQHPAGYLPSRRSDKRTEIRRKANRTDSLSHASLSIDHNRLSFSYYLIQWIHFLPYFCRLSRCIMNK